MSIEAMLLLTKQYDATEWVVMDSEKRNSIKVVQQWKDPVTLDYTRFRHTLELGVSQIMSQILDVESCQWHSTLHFHSYRFFDITLDVSPSLTAREGMIANAYDDLRTQRQ